MNLDKRLNLVVPIERDDGVTVYMHSTPLSRAVFDQYFYVIAKTFTEIYTGGFMHNTGPRIAAKLLKKVAADVGSEAVTQVETGLFPEIRRLTNVVAPGAAGWQSLPLNVALQQNLVSADDAEEAENAICFFMLASAMHTKKEARWTVTEAAKLWAGQTTLLNSTEFVASLPMSTPAAAIGVKETPSSIAT